MIANLFNAKKANVYEMYYTSVDVSFLIYGHYSPYFGYLGQDTSTHR